MPARFVFPAPEIIGTVPPAAFDPVAEMLTKYSDDSTNLYAVAYLPSETVDMTLNPARIARSAELRDALEPFIVLGGSWLHAHSKALKISITGGSVQPGESQRGITWHQDAGRASYRAITVASTMPTEFATGTLRGELDTNYFEARHSFHNNFDESRNRLVDEALACGQLTMSTVYKPYDVVAFDARHMHRSPNNNSCATINRLFLRIATSGFPA